MRIHNLVIIDASGSMSAIYDQALSGVNETIQTIRHAQAEHPDMRQYLTLASFSNPDDLVRVYQAEPIEFVNNIEREDYSLRGCTALYDAMGTLITETQKRVKHDDVVLVTVITDGLENASKKWNGQQLKSLVEELRQMGWTFTFIGANQDVFAEASKIGIRNYCQFDSNPNSTEEMFNKESASRASYYKKLKLKLAKGDRSIFTEEQNFFDEE